MKRTASILGAIVLAFGVIARCGNDPSKEEAGVPVDSVANNADSLVRGNMPVVDPGAIDTTAVVKPPPANDSNVKVLRPPE